MRSAPTLKIWMTPFASVAMLEKLALLNIALCRAPVLSNAAWRWISTLAATALILDMSLSPRYARQLFQAGHALNNPARAVLPQRPHAVRDRVVAQLLLRCATMDQSAQAVVDRQHFVNAGAAAVTRLVADGATQCGIYGSARRHYAGVHNLELSRGSHDRLPAFLAELANQALRDDSDQAGGEQKRLHAHVGILAQDGPQRPRHPHLHPGPALRPADPLAAVLDRVPHGHHVERGRL